MPDVEKVIKGLEMSYKYSNVDENNTLVPQWIVLHALALLKAQEPKKAKRVILQRLGSDALIGYECGNCGKHINQNDKYCHECGRAVKWDG